MASAKYFRAGAASASTFKASTCGYRSHMLCCVVYECVRAYVRDACVRVYLCVYVCA